MISLSLGCQHVFASYYEAWDVMLEVGVIWDLATGIPCFKSAVEGVEYDECVAWNKDGSCVAILCDHQEATSTYIKILRIADGALVRIKSPSAWTLKWRGDQLIQYLKNTFATRNSGTAVLCEGAGKVKAQYCAQSIVLSPDGKKVAEAAATNIREIYAVGNRKSICSWGLSGSHIRSQVAVHALLGPQTANL